MANIPVLSIVGASGSGKTTLLEKLIPELRRRGYCVAVIKHHPQAGLALDTPGKDTERLARAGAVHVVLAAPDQVMHHRRLEREQPLAELLAEIRDVDLVLTEGFKREPIPKVEVNRRAHTPTLLDLPGERVAVVSDQRFAVGCPQFGLDDVAGLADLIEREFLHDVRIADAE